MLIFRGVLTSWDIQVSPPSSPFTAKCPTHRSAKGQETETHDQGIPRDAHEKQKKPPQTTTAPEKW